MMRFGYDSVKIDFIAKLRYVSKMYEINRKANQFDSNMFCFKNHHE